MFKVNLVISDALNEILTFCLNHNYCPDIYIFRFLTELRRSYDQLESQGTNVLFLSACYNWSLCHMEEGRKDEHCALYIQMIHSPETFLRHQQSAFSLVWTKNLNLAVHCLDSVIQSMSKSVLLSMCALLSYANWMKSTTTGENDAIEPNTQYNRNTFVHIITQNGIYCVQSNINMIKQITIESIGQNVFCFCFASYFILLRFNCKILKQF